MEPNKNIVNKKIIVIVALIIIAFGAFWLLNKNNQPNNGQIQNDQNPNVSQNISTSTATTSITIEDIDNPNLNDPKEVAWQLFQKYLTFNKNHDLEGVRGVVYKIAPICADPTKKVDCEKRMDQAYYYGSALKKSDFVNVWSDSKQTILSSDFKIEQDDETISRVRSIIFFVKQNDGFKMLSFSPFKGAVSQKGSASNEELHDRVVIYTEDKDEDGISDYNEQCLGVTEGQTCIKTDPKLRDTDHDGYWDGVEVLMK